MRAAFEHSTGRRAMRTWLGALLLTISLLGICGIAQAQTFTVTNTTDSGVSGDGSLRGEVLAANSSPGADSIAFLGGLSGTITLTKELQIHEALDIEGPGPGQLTVAQSTPKERVFHIEMTGPTGPVTIAGLHVANGSTADEGGDIYNDDGNQASILSIVNCAITGGTAGEYGGAIDGDDAPLTIRSSSFEGNHALGGGAVWAGGDGHVAVTIESSTFSGNSTQEFGGALFIEVQEGGSVVVADSTFSGNTSKEEAGGIAISTDDETKVSIANSTVTGNTSAKNGGAGIDVEAEGETVTVADSTIADNQASGKLAIGGGIAGSGVHPIKLEDTIVSGNTAAVEDPDLAGAFTGAFDLIGNPTGAKLTETSPGSDLLGVDPQLGPLQANGGPTPTMALPASSPAVNKGGGAMTSDQRGLPRPVAYPGIPNSAAAGANGADIGAFELQAPPSNLFTFGKVKLNKKKGTAAVAVKLPDAGSLVFTSKKAKKVTKTAKSAGTVKVLVRAKGKALRALKRAGKLKLKAMFTFTPNGGFPASKPKKLKLIKKR